MHAQTPLVPQGFQWLRVLMDSKILPFTPHPTPSQALHHLFMLRMALEGSLPSSLARLSSLSHASSLTHWWLEKSSLHFPL